MAAMEVNGNHEANGSSADAITVVQSKPTWLTSELFEDIVKKEVTKFVKINEFRVKPAMAAGENYATVMARVEIIAQLEDGKTKALSYMLKLPHNNEKSRELMTNFNIFEVETRMYTEVVPEFEQIYRRAGMDIQFGAQLYKLPTAECQIALEDLCARGFKNANRLEGLDMVHTKCVLKKLAQWHAASAVHVTAKGKYADIFVQSVFKEDTRAQIVMFNELLSKPFMTCIQHYEGHEIYEQAVRELQAKITNEMFKNAKPDPNEFNVLNHGDCWCNNIMFQYDAFGKIKETYFVDLQVCKYGTPAQDLFYFILSSTKFEIKLKQFEYFIKYYYDQLVEHLQLLKYTKKMPSLKELHMMLYKYGLFGFTTASGVMGATLLEPSFLGDTESAQQFKLRMYSHERYRKHIEAILPWLYNRGALD